MSVYPDKLPILPCTRPVRGGVWGEVSEDVSLQPGGYGNPPCPQISCEFGDTRCLRQPRSVVYRFGCFGGNARQV